MVPCLFSARRMTVAPARKGSEGVFASRGRKSASNPPKSLGEHQRFAIEALGGGSAGGSGKRSFYDWDL